MIADTITRAPRHRAATDLMIVTSSAGDLAADCEILVKVGSRARARLGFQTLKDNESCHDRPDVVYQVHAE
jgi:hypothetical protein